MSSVPLEVHEVLEQEFVSMHGELQGIPGPAYKEGDLLDPSWGRIILSACALDPGEDLLAALNRLVEGEGLSQLCGSPAISKTGRELIDDYEEYTEGVSSQRKLEINRRIVDEALPGAVRPLRDVRLDHLYAEIHRRPDAQARTALCISGGGIRSATFALGVIQGLASAGVLDKFDYLSTVSGGGYIGSWLSSWARRHPFGISGVQDDLVRADVGVSGTQTTTGTPPQTTRVGKAATPQTKLDPEPRPVKHLREFSNYLSPKLGLASADTWTIGSLYLRNLLLNLLVLVPLLAAVLFIPRLYSLLLRTDRSFLQPSLLGLAVLALAVGFGYLGAARPTIHGRRAGFKNLRWMNTNGGFVALCIVPLTVAATAMSLYWAQAADEPVAATVADWPWGAAAAAVMTLLPSVIYYTRFIGASAIERRESLQRQKNSAEHFFKKICFELAGALLGVVTAAVLFYVLATKTFTHPLRAVPDLTWVPPYLRGFFSAVPTAELYVCFSVSAILLVFFLQAAVFVGISGRVNEDYDREWWGRAGGWLLMTAGFLAFAAIVSIFGPVLLYRAPVLLASIGGVSGLVAALLGFSAKTPASSGQQQEGGKSAALTKIALSLAVPLFVLFFLAVISLGTTWAIQQVRGPKVGAVAKWAEQFQTNATVTRSTRASADTTLDTTYETGKMPLLSIATVNGVAHLQTVHATEWPEVGVMALLALAAFGLSFFIGVNRFSMHALYRNRLMRAYLGASRYGRDPDAFTGFDAHDNLQMYELRHELLWPTSFSNYARFVETLRTTFTSDAVVRTIWNTLDKKTRHWLEDRQHPVDDLLMNALIQNINEILLSGDLGGDDASSVALADETVKTGSLPAVMADPSPAARLQRNRQTLQTTFADSLRPMHRRAPMHVVNTALNLVAGEKLAWQERKAESFTVSPLHAGSLYLGYRDSKEYGGDDGISLGTAVTISGAAASPNMGYHSSGAMAFLLTILNVRLGSWLGNPGVAGKKTYDNAHPRTNLEPMLWELTGKTNDACPLVYLSDGGHFENLALYEMVLRRCRYIVVSDAGSDAKYTFDDLGNAIRKIRTDLGIPIDIEEMSMSPRVGGGELKEGRYVATATIRYSAIDGPDAPPGLLIYLKPGLYRDDYFPRDVYNYAQTSPDFPHESTADQFFSESQFESYRALGRHVINEICANYAPRTAQRPRLPYANSYATVADFALAVEKQAHRLPPAPLQDLVNSGIDKLSLAIGGLGTLVRPTAPPSPTGPPLSTGGSPPRISP
jgi:hypothetical protein